MKTYKVGGLSCAHCTNKLESRIQKLKYGETAALSYSSGRLLVDDHIPYAQIEKILKEEGAYIEHEGQEDQNNANSCCSSTTPHAGDYSYHDHLSHSIPAASGAAGSNPHSKARLWNSKTELGLSAVLYVLALALERFLPLYFIIALFVVSAILSGRTTFIKGAKRLFRFDFTIDTLMTIALIGAAAIGEWKEAALVAILFGLNEHLEGLGMEKARRSMDALLKTAPREAILIQGQSEQVVPVASLQAGDLVLVRPGDQIPSDGVIVEGVSSVNEAAITGESLPVDKGPEQAVFGGSLNNEGVLKIRIEKRYEDSSLAQILHLVKEAQETKTPTELFINRFAKYYTPLILVISALVILIPPLFFGGNWIDWLYQGLAVLIVGCPCALILSSPVAILSGITRNARHGILVKGGAHLEQLGKINTVAFDKTGTLTTGKPYVEKTIAYEGERFLHAAAAIEKASSHPLALAILREAERHGIRAGEAEQSETIPGQGITAIVDGERYWIGNEKSLSHLNLPDSVQEDIEKLKEEGYTLVIVSDSDRVLGMFGISDEVRPESSGVLSALHRLGIRRTVMLTGDHPQSAAKVAQRVGITDTYSGLMPAEKVDIVRKLSAEGAVAMVGDGINDAPALATAQLGIAMGKGTASAIETADVVLMQNHLGKLPEAIALARRVNRIIRWNISLSLGLKLIALILAVPGLLTLWIAILSDMGATILVTLISLSILIESNKVSPK
ncbi:cation-translocating P-type ATPase [Paenibacillus sp. J2TS4]|uniref:heavy metal translocating P-type ATPase n=1 Tax=Paenibacillus sp. J2TS4 TaxID=2807194 RepID=UPI001B20803D|nr:heavy metal translocating P-type ATPase [Paenibacillus sp. J2TS4]GIP35683.1 copper-translocating P-type ATPase [Paenibacillus sp. J2TS4]